MRLAGEWSGPHGGAIPKFIEPVRESGSSVTKAQQLTELEPIEAGSQRNMAHMDGGRDIQLALQPVISSGELFDVSVSELRVAQRLRSANGLPPDRNAMQLKQFTDYALRVMLLLPGCSLKVALDRASRAFIAALNEVTLADLLNDRQMRRQFRNLGGCREIRYE